MDGNKIRDPLLATVPKEETIPAAVQRASRWALLNACGTVVYFALALAVTYALGGVSASTTSAAASTCAFVLRCVQWTDAEAAAEATALWLGMLYYAVLQAAAAALALQLPCRRPWVRRALAYLALVITFVGHCMYAAAVRLLLAADPGIYVFARILCTANIVVTAGATSSTSWASSSWEVTTDEQPID